jgi:hypothetical protein
MMNRPDGFDHYAVLTTYWDAVVIQNAAGGQATIAIAPGLGRPDGPALSPTAAMQVRIVTGAGEGIRVYAQRNVAAQAGPFIIGIAFFVATYTKLDDRDSDLCLLSFADGSVNQVGLYLDQSGHLYFMRVGNNPFSTNVLLGSKSLKSVTFWAYHYLEVKVVINNGAGVAEAKVDGSFFLQLSALNTDATGSGLFGSYRIGHAAPMGNNQPLIDVRYDDLVPIDNNAGLNTDYIGDRHVYTTLPSGAGTPDQWTPVGEATNWQAQSLQPPDPTKYSQTGTVTNASKFTFPALPVNVTNIAGADYLALARTDGAGNTLRILCEATDNGADLPLNGTFTYYDGIFETDPATGVAWLFGGINGAQAGIKLTG